MYLSSQSQSQSLQDLSLLRQQWPPAVLRHMVWQQQDLEMMCADAKQRFRQTQPSSCVYCGTWIKCDMYRHVAKFHLDLAQLWRCPVSWCTVWKGTPQDCMDHVRGVHDVPWDIKSASLEKFVPPWTVRRHVWSDSLEQRHSGISTDILLFGDINLSLVHHYRIHKRGLPHIAFRRNYMSWMRALLPSPVAQPKDSVLSPVSTGSVLSRQARSAELVGKSPRRTRRAKRRIRPVRVTEGSVDDLPILTIQDAADVQGEMVYDCQPPLLPVSLEMSIGLLSVRGTVVAASVAVPPWEEGLTNSGVDSDGVVFPGLGVVPLVDSGTDLEDELSTPDGSPSTDVVKPGEVVLPEICPALWGGIAFDLVKALLEVSVLPPMVTPIVDPVVESLGTPALYPEPPLPELSVDEQVPVLESVDEQVPVLVSSPFREVDSQSYRASPTGPGYEPITSPISPSLRTPAVSRSPSGLAPDGPVLAVG